MHWPITLINWIAIAKCYVMRGMCGCEIEPKWTLTVTVWYENKTRGKRREKKWRKRFVEVWFKWMNKFHFFRKPQYLSFNTSKVKLVATIIELRSLKWVIIILLMVSNVQFLMYSNWNVEYICDLAIHTHPQNIVSFKFIFRSYDLFCFFFCFWLNKRAFSQTNYSLLYTASIKCCVVSFVVMTNEPWKC